MGVLEIKSDPLTLLGRRHTDGAQDGRRGQQEQTPDSPALPQGSWELPTQSESERRHRAAQLAP